MKKALFLKTVATDEWEFKQGETYSCLVGKVDKRVKDIPEMNDMILIRQPNSPKGKDWWSKFPKAEIGKTIELCD